MYFQVLKIDEHYYNIKKLDKNFRLLMVLEQHEKPKIIKKFKELKEPNNNLFWYNSNDKLQWEIVI